MLSTPLSIKSTDRLKEDVFGIRKRDDIKTSTSSANPLAPLSWEQNLTIKCLFRSWQQISQTADQIYSFAAGYSGLQINTSSLFGSKGQVEPFQNLVHVFVCLLHGLGSKAHVFQNFGVGVGIFQSFSLELDGWQCPVDPRELLFIPLFPLQGLEGSWTQGEGRTCARILTGRVCMGNTYVRTYVRVCVCVCVSAQISANSSAKFSSVSPRQDGLSLYLAYFSCRSFSPSAAPPGSSSQDGPVFWSTFPRFLEVAGSPPGVSAAFRPFPRRRTASPTPTFWVRLFANRL